MSLLLWLLTVTPTVTPHSRYLPVSLLFCLISVLRIQRGCSPGSLLSRAICKRLNLFFVTPTASLPALPPPPFSRTALHFETKAELRYNLRLSSKGTDKEKTLVCPLFVFTKALCLACFLVDKSIFFPRQENVHS